IPGRSPGAREARNHVAAARAPRALRAGDDPRGPWRARAGRGDLPEAHPPRSEVAVRPTGRTATEARLELTLRTSHTAFWRTGPEIRAARPDGRPRPARCGGDGRTGVGSAGSSLGPLGCARAGRSAESLKACSASERPREHRHGALEI